MTAPVLAPDATARVRAARDHPAIDCTCGGAAARQAELDRRHRQSLADAADTVELHNWRGRMRGKGWLS